MRPDADPVESAVWHIQSVDHRRSDCYREALRSAYRCLTPPEYHVAGSSGGVSFRKAALVLPQLVQSAPEESRALFLDHLQRPASDVLSLREFSAVVTSCFQFCGAFPRVREVVGDRGD